MSPKSNNNQGVVSGLVQVELPGESLEAATVRSLIGRYVLPPGSAEPLLILGIAQKQTTEGEICVAILLGEADVSCIELLTWKLVE